MRRNSSRFSVPLLVLAPMLVLTLTLALAGTASAAPLHSTKAPVTGAPCLSAAPSFQKVVIDHPAGVDVTIECQESYLYVTWGDGTTSTYPVCVEVCGPPPIVISTSHTYTVVGDYHPLFCPSLNGSVNDCVSVEILVLPQ